MIKTIGLALLMAVVVYAISKGLQIEQVWPGTIAAFVWACIVGALTGGFKSE